MKKYIGLLIVLGVLVFGGLKVQAITSANIATNACTSTTAPWIKVLSPNGGETYTMGQSVTVKWKTCNALSGQTISLGIGQEVSPGAFSPFVSFYPYQIANDGTETITLGATSTNGNWPFVSGSNYKVSAILNPIVTSVHDTPFVQDQSDNSFTINKAGTTNNITNTTKGTTIPTTTTTTNIPTSITNVKSPLPIQNRKLINYEQYNFPLLRVNGDSVTASLQCPLSTQRVLSAGYSLRYSFLGNNNTNVGDTFLTGNSPIDLSSWNLYFYDARHKIITQTDDANDFSHAYLICATEVTE